MFFSNKGQAVLKYVLYAIIIISAVMAIISVASGFIMDYYWFKSVGYLQVFMVNIKYQLVLLFLGWIITTVCLFLSWRTISKTLGEQLPEIGGTLFKVFSIFVGFGVGWWLRGKYLIVLKFLNQTSWGVADPIFHNDISFYIFTLPMVRTILTFIGILSGLVLFLMFFSYGVGRLGIVTKKGEVDFSSEASFQDIAEFIKSWPILGSIIALTAVGVIWVWIGRYSYLWGFNPGASVPIEASYMAVNYHIPYTWIKAIGAVLLGVLAIRVLLNADEIQEKLEFGDFAALKKEIIMVLGVVLIFLVIPGVVFGAINTLNVEPNEPGIQKPYLKNGIKFTNQAYNLDNITRINYSSSSDNLSTNEALESPTVQNARIVDYRPVKETYEEKQRLRTYYEFHDVDVDRYLIEDEKKTTVFSGREMDKEGGGWQNQHLYYTHGFGAVASPASEKEPDGSPIMKIRDIPPENYWKGLEIKQPRIYFGEKTDKYVVVNAEGLDELDYPLGENNQPYRYQYDSGIKLDSPWKKLITWFHTGDFKVLVSDYVGKNSKLLLHRNVHDRVKKIAPFLRFDQNAHLFIGKDGGLNYLLNGISWTERYPYSYSDNEAPGYLSDSVKTFVKTNTGEVNFYMVNEDPMVKTFSKIYPPLFKEKEEMPEKHEEHLIYPPSLFDTQMKIFRRYHMQNHQSFYQEEDLWTPAEEKYHGQSKRVEPYNILLDTTNVDGFEEKTEEFTLMKPFTPKDKNNMRAWVGVGQDPTNYGRMIAIEFPKGELARGPMQVESIIDQNTEISRQFSLWEGGGSKVLRGNLLVLPVKKDILYIEPIYLSAETLAYPQLKRIVAVYQDEAVMENTLERAVKAVLGEEVGAVAPPENVIPGENIAPVELVQVVQEYLELREEYNKLISEGEYAKAGEVRENMARIEENMRELTG